MSVSGAGEPTLKISELAEGAGVPVATVRHYLREFLGDPRVIDYPAWLRWLLLEGIILRLRPRRSARAALERP